jgi:hypothetical protein
MKSCAQITHAFEMKWKNTTHFGSVKSRLSNAWTKDLKIENKENDQTKQCVGSRRENHNRHRMDSRWAKTAGLYAALLLALLAGLAYATHPGLPEAQYEIGVDQ